MSALLCLLLIGSACSVTVDMNTCDDYEEGSGSTLEEDVGISTLLQKANRNLGKNVSDQLVFQGDIALPYGLQNADPCTARKCLWPKACDGKVYVPYRISNQYSRREKCVIEKGLRSFEQSTCIRFIPCNRKRQRNFLDIKSDRGCYSYLGRQNGPQVVSLDRDGCVYHSIVQHELLHALGFNHEQSRSDRDLHVRILWQNIKPDQRYNFNKVRTNNLCTPYDYNSVMHYGRYDFSFNQQPTIVPIPDPNVCIGRATKMSANDILRVNRLYKCKKQLEEEENK